MGLGKRGGRRRRAQIIWNAEKSLVDDVKKGKRQWPLNNVNYTDRSLKMMTRSKATTRPNAKGKALIGGTLYHIAAWTRESASGIRYWSLAFEQPSWTVVAETCPEQTGRFRRFHSILIWITFNSVIAINDCSSSENMRVSWGQYGSFLMFRGIGQAEKSILAYLAVSDGATAADIAELFPKLYLPNIRRAMKSVAAKGGARLDDTPPMTVYRIGPDSASEPRQALPPTSDQWQALTRLASVPKPSPEPTPVTVQATRPPPVQPRPAPHPEAKRQAAQLQHGVAIKPVVQPGSGIELVPASATGGFDRPKI